MMDVSAATETSSKQTPEFPPVVIRCSPASNRVFMYYSAIPPASSGYRLWYKHHTNWNIIRCSPS